MRPYKFNIKLMHLTVVEFFVDYVNIFLEKFRQESFKDLAAADYGTVCRHNFCIFIV
jgi:hypothetical protein